jgi:hypothetical protein
LQLQDRAWSQPTLCSRCCSASTGIPAHPVCISFSHHDKRSYSRDGQADVFAATSASSSRGAACLQVDADSAGSGYVHHLGDPCASGEHYSREGSSVLFLQYL